MFPLIIMAVVGMASAGIAAKGKQDATNAQQKLDKVGLARHAVNTQTKVTSMRVNADRIEDKFRRDKLSLAVTSKQTQAANQVKNAVLGIEGVSAGDIMAAEQISSDMVFNDINTKRDQVIGDLQQQYNSALINLGTTTSDLSLQHQIQDDAIDMSESVLGGLVQGGVQGYSQDKQFNK